MTTAATTGELRFDPPGPGSWKIDPVHFPRPATRYWTEMHPEPFMRGFARVHALLRHADRRRSSTRTSTASPTGRSCRPPEAEIPERFQRAAEVFERKLWREQLRDWDETFKPAAIRTHRELQAVDPDALSDEELAAYLQRCRDHHAEMVYQHMRFTAASMVADRRLPRARGRLDRAPAGRAART